MKGKDWLFGMAKPGLVQQIAEAGRERYCGIFGHVWRPDARWPGFLQRCSRCRIVRHEP